MIPTFATGATHMVSVGFRHAGLHNGQQISNSIPGGEGAVVSTHPATGSKSH